jgi:hypothetical protein
MLTRFLGSPDAESWENYLRGNIVLKITYGFKVVLTDGTVLKGIDHDSPKTLDIGDGTGASLFGMNNGFGVRSNVERSITMEPDIFDISGFISESLGISKNDLRLGRYRDADCWLFVFRWDDLTFPVIPFGRGKIGDTDFGDDFTLDFRSLTDLFAQSVGATQTIDCPFDFMGQGDGTTERFCGVVRSPSGWLPSTAYTNDAGRDAALRDVVTAHGAGSPTGSPDLPEIGFEVKEDAGGTSGATEPTWNQTIDGETSDGSVTWVTKHARVVRVTITAATTPTSTEFTVDYAGTAPDEFFQDGLAEFEGGILDGVKEQIESFVSSTGLITLSLPVEIIPVVGQSLDIVAGCNKTMNGGFEGSPSGSPNSNSVNCLFYNNNWRFGGEHHKPGDLALLRAVRP